VRVSWKDILLAYEFADLGGMGEHRAFLCKESGRIYVRSDFLDDLEELPDDLEESEKYLRVPNKRELGLGKPLVLQFARHFLPSEFEEVRRIFNKRGAYARFKGLLVRRRALDRWFDFQEKATERALREWCELNSIEVGD
jgi:hypothetical protein